MDSDADKAPQTVTHLNANADEFTNELNTQGYLARRVRQDTDRVPRPLDFRLAIPAGALWVSLLVAQWCGALGLVPSSWIAGVALGFPWSRPGSHGHETGNIGCIPGATTAGIPAREPSVTKRESQRR
ncbi:hypothetical protein [Mobiluncus mulieris]|uniref:hypothetical protein n=1 Tax=Mobiluncus mulieris TaxID=2052 RepID=UPI002092E067|nr:hypothetical protein [Mobiluncus mulieris]